MNLARVATVEFDAADNLFKNILIFDQSFHVMDKIESGTRTEMCCSAILLCCRGTFTFQVDLNESGFAPKRLLSEPTVAN